MRRDLFLYAFSASMWRALVGCGEPAVRKRLAERSSKRFGDSPEHEATIKTLIDGSIDGTIDASCEESWPHAWLARELITIGQEPSPAPPLDLFWRHLGQTCVDGGIVRNEAGDKLLTESSEERRVVRWIREGRPLFGDRFGPGFAGASPLSDIYGWINAEDMPSLLSLVANPSWALAPIQARYQKRWESQMRAAAAWVRHIVDDGRDVFFSSQSND